MLPNGVLDSWNATKSSKILIVTNYCDIDYCKTNNGFLPCTAMCSNFLRSQNSTSPNRVTLKWYCGYLNDKDVREMSLSLLGQLLNSDTTGVQAPESRHQSSERFQFTDFESVQKQLMRRLCLQLQKTPVHCFIDSVNEYEKGMNRREDLYTLIETLASVTETSYIHPFKLLITASSYSQVGEVISGMDCETVHADVIDIPLLGYDI